MKLHDIAVEAKVQGLENAEIRSITDNLSKLEQGDIFVCISGKTVDGHQFAKQALGKGAAAVVVERDLGLDRQIVVENSRAYFSKIAKAYYGNPTEKLKLIGVTGTNGKTTIAHIVKSLIHSFGHQCGSIGTVGYDVSGKIYDAHLTTPEPMELYRYFAEMVKNGVEYCVMEASSQALSQSRFAHETFEVGIFTNLTQDHLDWHGSMENYYQAKKMLFGMSKSAILNISDAYGKRLADELEMDKLTYSSTGKADFSAENIKNKITGSTFWIIDNTSEKAYPVLTKLPGYFNVDNVMAALGAISKLGFDLQTAILNVEEINGEKGRCELIYHNDFYVISDYAHTADALVKILQTVKSFATARIICLFGAAGNRDEGKRKPMGEAAAEYADYLIVTTDNPRFEDPQKLIDDVLVGVGDKKPFSTFIDRKEAIHFALDMAKQDDIVVLAGKGHETYQVIGDVYMDLNEQEIVREYFRIKK